ncbi:MAG: beta-N-acetylhexosaminidase [Candidatus Binatia bacterium]
MPRHDPRVTAAESGRLFFVGIPGLRLDPATRRVLERLHVGGVILFRRNFDTPAQIAELTAALHALPSQPLVGIDHEGGRVLRLGEPFTQFPPAARVGRGGDATLAFRVGQAMAAELRSVGIDLNFAPVLDVHSNPANPIIGDRAFSSDPEVVSQCGIAMMRGLLAGGVIPCGKHFPGHGDTVADSHRELPVVRRSRAELERTELRPFRAAIAADIPMLMTAHVLYPALDPTGPATVSTAILTDLLRTELRFAGVIVSDDLEMRAIADRQTIAAAAVATLRAGADALLVCQDLRQAALAVRAVARGVGDGALPATVVRAALTRLGRLRQLRPGGSPLPCALPSATHRALARSC